MNSRKVRYSCAVVCLSVLLCFSWTAQGADLPVKKGVDLPVTMKPLPAGYPVPKVPAPLPPGPAPASVTATAVSPTSVRVSWAPLAGASGYTVWRAAGAIGPFLLVGTVAQPINREIVKVKPGQSEKLSPHVDAGQHPNSTMYYRIIANYPTLSPGVSAVVGATTPLAPQPKNFRAYAGLDSILLAWTAPPFASGYKIRRGDGTWLNNGQSIRGVTFLDTGLPPMKTQTYRLVAYYMEDGVGEIEGDLTQLPEASEFARTADATGNFRVIDTGGPALEFRWDYSNGVSEYKLMRALASDGIFMEQGCSAMWGDSFQGWCCINQTAVVGQSYYYRVVKTYSPGSAGDPSHILFVKKLP